MDIWIMTIKKNIKNAIDAFNQGFHGTTPAKETPPSKPDPGSNPVKKHKGQRVLRKRQ